LKNLLNRTACFVTSRFNHTVSISINQGTMQVHILSALSDNYMYLLEDLETKETVVIDPFDSEKVINKVNELGLKLTKVLTTHHHYDHSGGNKALVKKLKHLNLEVIGDDRVPCVTKLVKHGDKIKCGNIEIECLHTPCHTSGHICYYVTKAGHESEPCVFTGDTLFQAGCGRFFEGTAHQMYEALICKLSKLPDNTKVYCGHEYTITNLKFALSIEPENQAAISRLEWAKKQREKNLPTVPSTIGEEKQFNPFMRVAEATVLKKVNTPDDITAMKLLRDLKDKFVAK